MSPCGSPCGFCGSFGILVGSTRSKLCHSLHPRHQVVKEAAFWLSWLLACKKNVHVVLYGLFIELCPNLAFVKLFLREKVTHANGCWRPFTKSTATELFKDVSFFALNPRLHGSNQRFCYGRV